MIPILSNAGLCRLDEIVRPGLLCAFDFDGTLAPIVPLPDHAKLPAAVLQRLIELKKYVPVAIITGRSLADIRPRLQFEPDYLVGNHGLEGIDLEQECAKRFGEICRTWKKVLSNALNEEGALDPNVQIEDKTYSLSVHYRLVRNRRETENQLLKLFSNLVPAARVMAGKCVFNLLPLEAADKGIAFQHLIRNSDAGSAIYIGDDVTDEDIFKSQDKNLLSVRVERASDSAAAFFLHSRAEVVQLLDEIIKRVRARHLNNLTAKLSQR
jgi:trehalose 6-phosphate phosphatase